jgi:hypothetical protein
MMRLSVNNSIHQMLLRTDERIRSLSPLSEAVFEVVLLALMIVLLLFAFR